MDALPPDALQSLEDLKRACDTYGAALGESAYFLSSSGNTATSALRALISNVELKRAGATLLNFAETSELQVTLRQAPSLLSQKLWLG